METAKSHTGNSTKYADIHVINAMEVQSVRIAKGAIINLVALADCALEHNDPAKVHQMLKRIKEAARDIKL